MNARGAVPAAVPRNPESGQSANAAIRPSLALYDAARAALAEARRVDEVKDIRDRMVAMQAYARQAKDGELLALASDIRLHAERKAGQLLARMAAQRERDSGRGHRNPGSRAVIPKLADLGVTPMQSHRWQRVAALDEAAFAARAEAVKRQASASLDGSRADLAAEKRELRARREAELATRQRALPERRYGVILADPEWSFENWSEETGGSRSAANHYPTSPTAAIAARGVGAIAAPDCVLLLWAIIPMLPDAFAVMAAWGFAYRSHQVWLKDRTGAGYWFRARHELLLLGVRGAPPCPAPGEQPESVIEAKAGRHSEKPEAALAWIETAFPNLPKIELNRRGPPRPGWDAWGLEAEGG